MFWKLCNIKIWESIWPPLDPKSLLSGIICHYGESYITSRLIRDHINFLYIFQCNYTTLWLMYRPIYHIIREKIADFLNVTPFPPNIFHLRFCVNQGELNRSKDIQGSNGFYFLIPIHLHNILTSFLDLTIT